MLNTGFKYFFLFAALVLLQVLVFNNIRLWGYANPQIYLFFILILPFAIKGYVLLLSAFFIGLVIDVFSDSLAIHASASVLLAFCRPGVVKLLTGHYNPEDIETPGYYSFGTFRLVIYSILLIIIHHTSLFFLEIFRFNEFEQTITRSLMSSAITLVFVLLAFSFLKSPSTKKRY